MTGVGATGSPQAYSGLWSSLGKMWKEEGFRGFMKGNGINVVRVSIWECEAIRVSGADGYGQIIPYSACQFVVSWF